MSINIIIVAIIEIIFLFLVLMLYRFSKKSWVKESLFNFKIKFKKFPLTLLLPITLSLILVVFYYLFFGKITSYPSSILLLIISAVLIAPLAEEILFRGILLGYVLKISDYAFSKIGKAVFISIGFIIQLILFVFLHQRLEWQNLTILIISGLLYSSLFLIYKKNLLPSIISHASTNLFVILSILIT